MATTNFTVATDNERKCNINYATWKDATGGGCNIMYLRGYCTKAAGYGDNWMKTFSNFDELSFDGFNAWACPQCGCYGNFFTIGT